MATTEIKLDTMSVGELRKRLISAENDLRNGASNAVSVLRALGRVEDAKRIESIMEVDLASGRPIVFKRGPRPVVTAAIMKAAQH